MCWVILSRGKEEVDLNFKKTAERKVANSGTFRANSHKPDANVWTEAKT